TVPDPSTVANNQEQGEEQSNHVSGREGGTLFSREYSYSQYLDITEDDHPDPQFPLGALCETDQQVEEAIVTCCNETDKDVEDEQHR
ncbi:hypothetical protein P5673_023247, partial [Acropora cervicornis]